MQLNPSQKQKIRSLVMSAHEMRGRVETLLTIRHDKVDEQMRLQSRLAELVQEEQNLSQGFFADSKELQQLRAEVANQKMKAEDIGRDIKEIDRRLEPLSDASGILNELVEKILSSAGVSRRVILHGMS